MNGITGLDASRARKDIDNFTLKCYGAQEEIRRLFSNLIEELRATWSSPKAKDFSIHYKDYLGYIDQAFGDSCRVIRMNAFRAYSVLASANGLQTLSGNDYDEPVDITYQDNHYNIIQNLEESRDGMVGMNVKMVRDFIIPAYKARVDAVIGEMESIPNSIAFYDDQGVLQSSYSFGINNHIERYKNEFSDLFEELYSAVETEADIVLFAKQQAQDILSA